MKGVIALLLVYILPAICLAQTSATHQLPDDITIVAAYWQYALNWRGNTVADVASGSARQTDTVELRGTTVVNGSTPTNSVARDPQTQVEERRAQNRLDLERDINVYLRTDRNAAVVTMHNDGAKTIRAVRYDFIFVNAGSGEELLRYQFRSKATINASETKTLTNYVVDRRALPPPIGPRASASGRIEYRVVVTRIDYADGSVWKRR
jgi:hypothetical protein